VSLLLSCHFSKSKLWCNFIGCVKTLENNNYVPWKCLHVLLSNVNHFLQLLILKDVNYISVPCQSDVYIFSFRIPPILSDKRTTYDRGVSNLESSMGHTASVQPTRTTVSAKSSRLAAAVSSRSRVHSSPTSRKGRQKDAANHTRQDLTYCWDGPNESVKPQANAVADTLPSDVKLSPEVIVSNSLKFIAQSFAFFVYSAWGMGYPFIPD